MKRKDLHSRVKKLSVFGPDKLLERVRFIEHIKVGCYDVRAGTHRHITATDGGGMGFLEVYAVTREAYQTIKLQLADEGWLLLEG